MSGRDVTTTSITNGDNTMKGSKSLRLEEFEDLSSTLPCRAAALQINCTSSAATLCSLTLTLSTLVVSVSELYEVKTL